MHDESGETSRSFSFGRMLAGDPFVYPEPWAVPWTRRKSASCPFIMLSLLAWMLSVAPIPLSRGCSFWTVLVVCSTGCTLRVAFRGDVTSPWDVLL